MITSKKRKGDLLGRKGVESLRKGERSATPFPLNPLVSRRIQGFALIRAVFFPFVKIARLYE